MSVSDGTILRIVAQFLMPESVIAQNIFYAVFNDTGGSNADQDVIDDCAEWVDSLFINIVDFISDTVDLQLVKVYVRDLIGNDWDELGNGTPVVTFSDVDTIVPHGVAALVHAFTTDPDVRGSKYIAGVADVEQTASSLSGGFMTALLLYCADWVSSWVGTETGGDFDPGVWSPTQVDFFPMVDHFIVNGQVGYQRRRKPGVGI